MKLAVADNGLGVSTPGMQAAAIESVELAHVGLATGMASTSRYLGSILASITLPGLLALGAGNISNLSPVFIAATLAAVYAAFICKFLPRGQPLVLTSLFTGMCR